MPAARILVVEDHPASLDLVCYLLQAGGYTTLSATDGRAGLDLARRERPDLVLCDLEIPEVDGYEVARSLKSDPDLQSIPLIAVSAFSMSSDREKALRAGFDEYYPKPIDPERFVSDVEQHLPARMRSGR